MRVLLFLRAYPYSFRLPLHHDSGSLYLFTIHVASWLDTLLLESVWDFNGMFTFYRGILLLSKNLAHICAGLKALKSGPVSPYAIGNQGGRFIKRWMGGKDLDKKI